MLLVNANILTLDPTLPRANAMAIVDGQIVCAGTEAECVAAAPREERRDVGGAIVVPGFTDAHVHLLGVGALVTELDLRGVSSEEELCARAAERAGASQPSWLRGFGWDETRFASGAYPTASALSRAVPDRPAYLRRIDGHAALANDHALRLAGVTASTPDPEGGRILRDAAGAPTGVLVDRAMGLVEKVLPAPTEIELQQRFTAALGRCAEAGITHVHDAGLGEVELRVLARLDAAGALPLRVYAMIDAASPGALEPWLRRGPWRGRNLTVRAVKLFLDGALGSRGAALFFPYVDDPSTTGLLRYNRDELVFQLRQLENARLQPALHAIGDRAFALALEALERAQLSPQLRPRIEHAELIRREDVERAARAGVVASMQPVHLPDDRAMLEKRLAAPSLEGAFVFRSLTTAGVPLLFGSDAPVGALSPLLGMSAAVRRRAPGYPEPFLPAQRLTPIEALRGYTEGAAFGAFEEALSGRLTPGRRADFTVLDADPTTVREEELERIGVRLTVVGGSIVWEA